MALLLSNSQVTSKMRLITHRRDYEKNEVSHKDSQSSNEPYECWSRLYVKIVIGDFNAKLDKWFNVGKFSPHDTLLDNVLRLIDFYQMTSTCTACGVLLRIYFVIISLCVIIDIDQVRERLSTSRSLIAFILYSAKCGQSTRKVPIICANYSAISTICAFDSTIRSHQ